MDESVESIGELGLIAAVTARFPQHSGVRVGPGDDAAVILTPDGQVVVTTDLLVEGQHFRLAWSSAYDVGRKAAAQNLADVVAMGAQPTALLVGVALPPDLDAAWPLALADGLRDECATLGASVVGGDVVRADHVFVAVTALGDLEGRAPTTRAGAQPGDAVAVAGHLGWSAAGLAVLERDGPGHAADLADVVDVHRRPCPPYELALSAARAGAPTAMIDISDGLLQDLEHIATASGVAIDVATGRLPIDDPVRRAAQALGTDPKRWVLAGGEDHALAACFRTGAPVGWRPIAAVRAGAGVTVDGNPPPRVAGFDHFRRLSG